MVFSRAKFDYITEQFFGWMVVAMLAVSAWGFVALVANILRYGIREF